jgi:hypothetical protein
MRAAKGRHRQTFNPARLEKIPLKTWRHFIHFRRTFADTKAKISTNAFVLQISHQQMEMAVTFTNMYTPWRATQRIMAAKRTGLTQKIALLRQPVSRRWLIVTCSPTADFGTFTYAVKLHPVVVHISVNQYNTEYIPWWQPHISDSGTK